MVTRVSFHVYIYILFGWAPIRYDDEYSDTDDNFIELPQCRGLFLVPKSAAPPEGLCFRRIV